MRTADKREKQQRALTGTYCTIASQEHQAVNRENDLTHNFANRKRMSKSDIKNKRPAGIREGLLAVARPVSRLGRATQRDSLDSIQLVRGLAHSCHA